MALNWEKYHFMVKSGIVLGHLSKKDTMVDKAKVELLTNLLPSQSVKDVRSFLGHADCYSRFIRTLVRLLGP